MVLLKYDSHTIQFIYLKFTIQWLLIYSQNCVSITINFRKFSLPQKETLYCLAIILQSPHVPQPQATTNLLSVSIGLPILDIAYKQNHTIYGLLCLACITQHNIFKVHPHCSMCQNFISLYGLIIFRCMYIPHFVYPFIC